jgi:hypothetical protein
MAQFNMIEHSNVFPLVHPIDKTTSTWVSLWVDMKSAHTVGFLCNFGVVTASADDTLTFKVECATVADTTAAEGTAVAFTYRLSGAATANTWGDPTAATAAAGYAPLCSAITGHALYIELDPAAMQTAVDTGRWVRLTVTPTAGVTADLASVNAILKPRYMQATMVSATA